jgi:hypothetical protein
MEHFYDAQIKRYLTQFMRLMSNFAYKDAKGKLTQIPVRYGDMNRQVAQIMRKNSENVVQSAPFIACYIKSLDFARDRLQDPTYVSKVNIRERAYDAQGREYLNTQGENYTVERLMPTPFTLQFTADIWTTNTDQKFQLLEQILVLFNPSMEVQSSSNYLDWTRLSVIELTNMTFSSRQVPQGLEQDIDIATLNFTAPIWITTPAKVKKLGIITQIITSMFVDPVGTIESGVYADSADTNFFDTRNPVSVDYITLGNLELLVLNNTAKLTPSNEVIKAPNNIDIPQIFGSGINWVRILDLYPGKFTAGLSQLRLTKPDGNEIVGHISLDPLDDQTMHISFDTDTVPMNTILTDALNTHSRGTVDAIVDPQTFNPRPLINGVLGNATIDARYLILEDINPNIGTPNYSGPTAWKNLNNSDFVAHANDIIQWDGSQWNVLFNSRVVSALTYITNARTGVQYAWDGASWMKSYEGIYTAGKWRLVL